MKYHGTVEVAAFLSKKLRRRVDSGYAGEKWREMHGVEGVGRGHDILISGPDRSLLLDYARETYARPNQPGIREWAEAHGRKISKLPDPKAFKLVRGRSILARKAEVISAVAQKERLEAQIRMAVLEEKVESLSARLGQVETEKEKKKASAANRSALKLLPWSGQQRAKILKAIKSFGNDRKASLPFNVLWSEVYSEFWLAIGGAPVEWYKSQMDNETKLDFFEKYPLDSKTKYIDDLATELPKILAKLSEGYPLKSKQGELSL